MVQESGFIRGINPKSKILLADDRYFFDALLFPEIVKAGLKEGSSFFLSPSLFHDLFLI